MAAKKYCNRCGHTMWYDETKKRWYCMKCGTQIPISVGIARIRNA